MLLHAKKQVVKAFHGSKKVIALYHGGKKIFTGSLLSSATLTALKQAFGEVDGMQVFIAASDYLNNMADKAKAQALANYINEDPMLVCSLGLSVEGVTMPTRWLVASGANCIYLGVQSTNETILRGTFRFTESNGDTHIGYHPGNDSQDWRLFNLNGTLYWDCGSGRISQSLPLNTVASIEVGDGYIVLNGTRKTAAAGTTIAKGDIAFAKAAAVDCADILEVYDGTEWHTFAPFMTNGVAGLVDLTGTVHLPLNGVMSISYTLPDGTPWTPANQA